MNYLDEIDAHVSAAFSEHESSVFHDIEPITEGTEAPLPDQNGTVLDRFTSRKFLITVAAAVAAILGATGVIDQAQEVTLVQSAVPILYILVQGLADYKGR